MVGRDVPAFRGAGSRGGSTGTFQSGRGIERRTKTSVPAIHRSEEALHTIRRLRPADEKHATGSQGKMENIESLLLRVAVQIDKQVATGNEIEPREGRVGQEIVRREEHHVAQLLLHPIVVFPRHKKPPQSINGYVCFYRRGINAMTRVVDRLIVDVRRENLD